MGLKEVYIQIDPQIVTSGNKEHQNSDLPSFPHTQAILELMGIYNCAKDKKFRDTQGNVDTDKIEIAKQRVRIIAEAYFTQAGEHLDMYTAHTEHMGDISFPVTSISVTTLAQDLLAKQATLFDSTTHNEELVPELTPDEPLKDRYYFNLPGAVFPGDGHPLTYLEKFLGNVAGVLPSVMKDLRDGKEPRDIRIYSLGMPNTDWGTVTPEMVAAVKKSYEPFGEIYGDYITSTLPEDDTKKANIRLIIEGISQGGNLTKAAGDYLINNGIAHQTPLKVPHKISHAPKEAKPQYTYTLTNQGTTDKHGNPISQLTPSVELIAYNAVGFHPRVRRHPNTWGAWQEGVKVATGFLAEFLIQQTDAMKRAGVIYRVPENKQLTLSLIDRYLFRKGHMKNIMPTQIQLRKQLQQTAVWTGVIKGEDPNDINVRITAVNGMKDPIQQDPAKQQMVREKRKTSSTVVLPHKNKNFREFAIQDMTHAVPLLPTATIGKLLHVGLQ